MATEPTPEQLQAIDAEIFAGRKIAAIKLYRTAAGVDLKDAKDAVEAREGKLRETKADQFQPKGGCMGVIVLMLMPVVYFVFRGRLF